MLGGAKASSNRERVNAAPPAATPAATPIGRNLWARNVAAAAPTAVTSGTLNELCGIIPVTEAGMRVGRYLVAATPTSTPAPISINALLGMIPPIGLR